MEAVYRKEGDAPIAALAAALAADGVDEDTRCLQRALSGVVWTPSMRRMYTLVDRCATLVRHSALLGMHNRTLGPVAP
jgi:midasin